MKWLNTIFFLLFISYTSIDAQDFKEKLLKNKDITWIAETEIYFSLETEKYTKEDTSKTHYAYQQMALETIKISPSAFGKVEYADNDNILAQLIFNGLVDDKIQAHDYKGDALIMNTAMDYFSQIDSFISFDQETYEQTIEVAYNDMDYIEGYLTKMLWYYNEKEENIYSKLLSYTPINKNYSKGRNEFIIPTHFSQIPNFEDKNIIWSKATKVIDYDFSEAEILKGNTSGFIKRIFKSNLENKTYEAFDSWQYFLSFKPYNDKKIDFILHQIEADTFISVDPETFEEKITISRRPPVNFSRKLLNSFVHYWYWDEEINSLSCELISIGLIEPKEKYNQPIFKIKAKNNIKN